MKVCELCVLDFTAVNLLANLIKSIEKKNHEVVTICDVNEHEKEIHQLKLKVIDFKIQRSFNVINHIKKIYSLRKIFKKEKFDVIHVHTPIGSIIGRIAALLSGNSQVYYTVHGFYFHEKMPLIKRSIFFAIEYILSYFTKKIFFQSKEDFIFAKKTFKNNKLFYIGNGIDLDFFTKDNFDEQSKKIFWEKYYVNKNPKILIVARLVRQKGILDIIELSKRDKMNKFNFIIIGSRNINEHDSGLDNLIELCKSQNNIFFLGYKENVKDFYQYSDAFILPSYREGKPRSIIEAMAMEIPIFTTNIRGSRELINPNIPNGFLFEPGDINNLEKLLFTHISDKDMNIKVTNNARNFANKFLNEKKIINKQIELMNLL